MKARFSVRAPDGELMYNVFVIMLKIWIIDGKCSVHLNRVV